MMAEKAVCFCAPISAISWLLEWITRRIKLRNRRGRSGKRQEEDAERGDKGNETETEMTIL
jgi:hypothetical protein